MTQWLLEHCRPVWEQLTAGDLKVLWALGLRANWQTGEGARPGLAGLVEASASSKPTVVKALAHLEALGIVRRAGSHRTALGRAVTVYALTYPGASGLSCKDASGSCKGNSLSCKGNAATCKETLPNLKSGSDSRIILNSSSIHEEGSCKGSLPYPVFLEAVANGQLNGWSRNGLAGALAMTPDGHAVQLKGTGRGFPHRIGAESTLRALQSQGVTFTAESTP